MKQTSANSDTIYDIQLPIPDFSIKLKLRGSGILTIELNHLM